MKEKADWLGWAFQFITGFVVGAVVGVFVLMKGWVPSHHFIATCAGFALAGAALASHYGDRLWLGDSYRVIPPDGVEHSNLSLTLSIMSGVTGLLLIVASYFP